MVLFLILTSNTPFDSDPDQDGMMDLVEKALRLFEIIIIQ